MAELLIMRHAKSDWGAATGSDHDRPLASRGNEAATRMGRFLSHVNMRPALVLSSTAERARRTAQLAAAAGGWSCERRHLDELYGDPPESVVELIAAATDALAGPLLVVGHEPTLSELVELLCGGGKLRLPTAAVVCVTRTAATWQVAPGGCAELRWMVTPKLLGRLERSS